MSPMQDIPSPEHRSTLLKKLHQAIIQWAEHTFSAYQSHLDEQLFTQAEQARSNQTQRLLLDIRQQLHQQQDAFQQHVCHALDLAYQHYTNGQPTYGSITSDAESHEQLTLVKQDELEQKLALSAMVNTANSNGYNELYALNKRLSALKGGAPIDDQGNPLAPAVFAQAYADSLEAVNFDLRSKLLVLKCFDQLFMRKLNDLYALINQQLQQRGILPHIIYDIEKYPLQEAPEEIRQLNNKQTLDQQLTLYQRIKQQQEQQLQQHPRELLPPQASTPQQTVFVNINRLQHNAAIQLKELITEQDVTASNTQALKEMAEREAASSNDIDADVIEIVGLMFEYMLNDEQLPTAVKSLLSYLHTPYLKMALQDKDFFNHPQHPARQLLNSLVAAGERWVEPSSKQTSEVFTHIKTVVQQVLEQYDNDVRLFSRLALEFSQFLRHYVRRIRLTEKRALQAAEGENKLREIRLRVDNYLHEKLAGLTLPSALETFVKSPWANYLAFNLLRYGSQSNQWRDAVSTLDDLLWFCGLNRLRTANADNNLTTLKQNLPERIKQGFDTIGYEHSQGQLLLQQLLAYEVPLCEALPNVTVGAVDIETVNACPNVAHQVSSNPHIQQLVTTDFGSWFIFNAHQAPQLQQRYKLAWANTSTLHFMFVNRLGQQVALHSGEELAELMQAGKLHILPAKSDKPFFEKALQQVFGQLERRAHIKH